MTRPRVLLIAEECDPNGMAGPLIGWKFSQLIGSFTEATLLTREKYRVQISNAGSNCKHEFIDDPSWIKTYSRFLDRVVFPEVHNWPVRRMLRYPLYNSFDRQTYSRFADRVRAGDFDIVHALTPLIPRYPFKIAQACDKVPFILGPLNGGLKMPAGFDEIRRRDFAGAKWLRRLPALLPGYANTYQKAKKILVGTQNTQEVIQDLFELPDARFKLLAENGLAENFFTEPNEENADSPLRLLFVGRLVPYKGAHFALEALRLLPKSLLEKVQFTIVGEGPQRKELEDLVLKHKLTKQVQFTGWVDQNETPPYYQASDLFCYPSVRESGGAVVLEAMAAGLPCLVVNHGGIGDYVTNESGLKIKPESPEQIASDLAKAITRILSDTSLRQQLAAGAYERSKMYSWEAKKEQLHGMYRELLEAEGIERGFRPTTSTESTVV